MSKTTTAGSSKSLPDEVYPKILFASTSTHNLELSVKQFEFIKDLYYGMGLSDNECIEKFTVACTMSFVEPSDVLKLAENDGPGYTFVGNAGE
jgi:hypothetical protein